MEQADSQGPAEPGVAEVVGRLAQWQAATQDVVAALEAERRETESHANRLESPSAILEHIDFFVGVFGRAIAEVDQIAQELPAGVRQEHVDALRQLASNAAVEQRRSVVFRDKWINRTLPYEQVRPMLNRISTLSRDRLNAFRELNGVADTLLQSVGAPPPPPAPGDPMDRRALFNRFLRRDGR